MRDLLTLLCKYPLKPIEKEKLSELVISVKDWDKTLRLINAHGIIALAAYNIKESGLSKEIPISIMGLLEAGYYKSFVRNTWLAENWKELNEILIKEGIKHVLLKGMALEHTIYGSRGLRQMTDNDILVSRKDAIKTWQILLGSGFSTSLIKSNLHNKIIADIGKHLPPLYKNGYVVEIHHKLFDTYSLFNNQIDPIENAISFNIFGTRAWMLPNELQLPYLIDHFNKHLHEGSVQLRQYADLVILDKNTNVTISESFINEPMQTDKHKNKKTSYKNFIMTIPRRYRLRYILGDIFPTMNWMRNRYSCNWIKAIYFYPMRLGKLLWLIQ